MTILLELAGKFSTMDAREVSLADSSTGWLDCGLTFKISSPAELDEPLPPLLELENDNDETGLPGLSGVPGVVVIVLSSLDELDDAGGGSVVSQEYVALTLVGLLQPALLQASTLYVYELSSLTSVS